MLTKQMLRKLKHQSQLQKLRAKSKKKANENLSIYFEIQILFQPNGSVVLSIPRPCFTQPSSGMGEEYTCQAACPPPPCSDLTINIQFLHKSISSLILFLCRLRFSECQYLPCHSQQCGGPNV